MRLDDFLKAFFPDEHEPIYFRAFKAKDAPDLPESNPLVRQITRAQLKSSTLQVDLLHANLKRGIYFVVNAGGNTDKEINRFNAFFVENDIDSIEEQHARLDRAPIPPSIRIITKKSVHAYWLTKDKCTADEWREIQLRLIAYFNGDEKIKNPSRLMRLPFFNHVDFNDQTGEYEYKRVDIHTFEPDKRFTVQEMQAAFPPLQIQKTDDLPLANGETQNSFVWHEDRHAELIRRIEVRGKRKENGFIETRCPVHKGNGESSLFVHPGGAVKCHNGCDYFEILQAFNLPAAHLASRDKNAALNHQSGLTNTNDFNNLNDQLSPKYENQNNEEFQSLFTIKPAPDWIESAKLRPAPKKLFGEFWHEGEICILFADTNLGKSILAVQIANSISKGKPLGYFALETEPQKVLYFDFELTDKQFEARYSIKEGDYFTDHYLFPENFLRAEINPESEVPAGFQDFESYLNFSLEHAIATSETKVLIVDNLTYLKNETERAKDALPLMKLLKALKRKYDLSILALAHTPKRDLTKPLTRNDLQGSKMLINFCDSSFAIGESHKDKGIRYFKQIKARNTEIIYDSENVCNCQIAKHQNFLCFEFSGFGSESEHLKTLSEADRANLVEQTKALSMLGRSQREIAYELGISLGSVNNYLKK